MSEFIHSAYDIGSGSKTPLPAGEIIDGLADDRLVWAHLLASDPASKSWLESEIAFLDPFIVSALTAEETRPRIAEIGDGVLIILRGMNFNPGQPDEDMIAVRLYADTKRIISVQYRPIRSVEDVTDDIHNGQGPKSAGAFLSSLIYKLSRKVDMAVAALDDQMDDTERSVVDGADMADLRRELSDIRLKSIKIRRHMAPQRDALFELKSSKLPWLSDTDRRAIHESYNRTVRALEELDGIRERAQIIKDEISNHLSEKLNRNTYVLSLIAAIFLPLGFLTGLFGINIGGLPGINNGNAFWIFCLSMIVLVIAQIVIFRKLKWF